MFLRFYFKNTDTCMGATAIAIFDENTLLIDKNTIDILYDGFKGDVPCTKEVFSNTPSSTVYCRKWNSGAWTVGNPDNDAELIIEIPNTKITKIGIGTWGSNTYPTENVTISACNSPAGVYERIGILKSDTRVSGVYKMVYIDTVYTVRPDTSQEGYHPTMLEQYSGLNSVIFKNPENKHLFDLSLVGTRIYENQIIEITQANHFFEIGDALAYNAANQRFEKALAENSILSEVCGVVSKINSINSFEIITYGELKTGRYPFEAGLPLYLSDIQPGKLLTIYPNEIVKEIATCTLDGIMIDIKRALKTTATPDTSTYEAYTQAELDEIISNIW